MSPSRESKLKRTVGLRQPDLTVVIENVHDTHNIGAIMRSCDSVGIAEIYVLYTDNRLTEEKFKVGSATSSGAKRWVDVHFYNDVEKCFTDIKKRYKNIFATHLSADGKSLFELELSEPTALVFGNEHAGITEESLSHATGNFTIPMMGMTQSLNISVACAVSIYEACRQRLATGKYNEDNLRDREELLSEYAKRQSKSNDR